MAANLMDLVRELKALNARKKAGEALSAPEEARRKELKIYLKNTLDAADATGSHAAVSPTKSQGPSAPITGVHPAVNVPVAIPVPVPVPIPIPMPVAVPVPAPMVVPVPAAINFDTLPLPVSPKAPATAPTAMDALFAEAMASDAVAKVDPFAHRKARATALELEETAAAADAAIRAQRRRDTLDSVEGEVSLGYTPPEDPYHLEQYYGSYADEGFVPVTGAEANGLSTIDPREAELQRIDLARCAKVPRGLAFIDDFPALYAKRVLRAPGYAQTLDSTDPGAVIPGKRKVTLQMLNGERKQGHVRVFRRGDASMLLEPEAGGTEDVAVQQCRVAFVHTANPKAPLAEPTGSLLNVTLKDGRAAQGHSDDFDPTAMWFSLVPVGAARAQFERIIVNAAFVQGVAPVVT